MKRIITFFFVLSFLSLSNLAFSQDVPEKVDQLQKQIDDLNKKVDDLEKARKHPIKEGVASPIEYRHSFADEQQAAPRPEDFTLDPEFRGFIPIPRTAAIIKFNAQPRVDFTMDNHNAGNVNRFVTATIPVSGDSLKGGGMRFNVNSQGSRLSMEIRAPGTKGNPRFYYENDFAGTGTAEFNFRVRHLYGKIFNFIVGQTYSFFEDADAWPDTVDYEGPNAAISSRRPLFAYQWLVSKDWLLNFSLEKPVSQVDTSSDPSAYSINHAPEGTISAKWMTPEFGHVQLGAVLREVSAKGDLVGKQEAFGWGLNLSGSINLQGEDSCQFQITYGHGIFYFMNDSMENGDGAYNEANKLKTLPVEAVTVGYTHWWNEMFKSTVSYGFVNLENEYSQAATVYHRTHYASANLILRILKRLNIGVEALYGYKQVKSGASGDAFRAQASVMYSIF